MAATASIIAKSGGQCDSYLSWIFFSALVICGQGTILQTFRVWRFGSGHLLSITSGTAFVTVCIVALVEGGPTMLSSLIVVSEVIRFFLIARISLLRRILTPFVTVTVLILLATTNLSAVLGRLFNSAKVHQCGPIIAILLGVGLALPLGLYDLSNSASAS